MALVKCRECGHKISNEAPTCPHCGAPGYSQNAVRGPATAPKKPFTVGVFPVIVVALGVVFWLANRDRTPTATALPNNAEALTAAMDAKRDQRLCSAAGISIKSIKASFEDTCRTRSCPRMKGVAVLTNSCPTPLGVQVKIVGHDAAGNPVAARELWPASVKNIPPGDYTFSLDGYLDYDPAIKGFSVEAVDTRVWR